MYRTEILPFSDIQNQFTFYFNNSKFKMNLLVIKNLNACNDIIFMGK